jgi:eukaryotic translation initiation factor 2C
MPPRGAPGRGGGAGGASRGGRGGATRGGLQAGLPLSGSHITTVGVKRPDFGTGGKAYHIFVNSFVTTVPDDIIHHYDGTILYFFSPFI